MTWTTRGLFGCVALLAFSTVGCASSPAPPFDSLKSANATALRLQNYEPPQQPTATPQAPAAGGALPGVPAEIQQWVQQGAAGLQQLIPPGLLPPGLIPPGGAAPAPAAQPAPQAQVPRFPNRPDGFRILSQTQVMDPDLKEELAELLGDEDSFHNQHANCMYAELGLAFSSTPGGPNNEVLISFSCNQVAAAGGFAWPHPSVGMTPDTVKELAGIVNRLFPPGV